MTKEQGEDLSIRADKYEEFANKNGGRTTRIAYFTGAVEQDPISRSDEFNRVINNACEWMRTHLPRVLTYYPDAEHTIENMLNEDMREQFKEAMINKWYD